jgi:hypothetical protein
VGSGHAPPRAVRRSRKAAPNPKDFRIFTGEKENGATAKT